MKIDRIIRELRHGAIAAGLFIALIAPGAIDAQAGGTITGIVTTRAAIPRPVRVTIDQRVCGNELQDESVAVNAAGQLANAVITLAGVKALPGAAASAGVMNEKCRFGPRVQIVRPNTTLTTSSADPILHTTNAQIEGGRALFNLALPVPGIKINRPLAGPGLVRLSCSTHPWMRGWILVTEDRAALSDSEGRFTLSDVPAGTYDLVVWHEALKAPSRKVTVTAGQSTTVSVELQ